MRLPDPFGPQRKYRAAKCLVGRLKVATLEIGESFSQTHL
jgi:hypothetical protein